jgi:hypothetical protein
MFAGGDGVAMKKEKVVDPVVGGEDMLCLSRRLEVLHLSFSPSRRLVRILRSVVQSLVLPVLDGGHRLGLCRTHAQSERETEIPPNRVADDLGRKPVAGIAGQGRHCHSVRLRDLTRHGKLLT